MKSEKLEVTRGRGNVFRDLGHANADIEQFKAILAAEIIKALDRDGLSVRVAHSRTGLPGLNTPARPSGGRRGSPGLAEPDGRSKSVSGMARGRGGPEVLRAG